MGTVPFNKTFFKGSTSGVFLLLTVKYEKIRSPLKIYDADVLVFERSGHNSLKILQKKRDYFTIGCEGVREKYEEEDKLYCSTPTNCSQRDTTTLF